MPVLERDIESRAVREVRRRFGLKIRKMNGLGFRGWPDRLFVLPAGRALWIEFKRPGGKLSALQEKMIKDLREEGHEVQVHDNADEAIAAVEAALLSATGGAVPARTRRSRALSRSGAG